MTTTYNVTMDDEKLGLKPETLFNIYRAIDAQARLEAPAEIRHELRISQDGRNRTKFNIVVSDRMATHLIAALQKQTQTECGVGLKTYLYKLQEQLMSQMFAGASETVNIRFG
jgi:hypothetical protein